jgi:hypothetical protein
MFDSETDKTYKSLWKHRKMQSKMDMLRKVISLGVVLQLIANIGELCNGFLKKPCSFTSPTRDSSDFYPCFESLIEYRECLKLLQPEENSSFTFLF